MQQLLKITKLQTVVGLLKHSKKLILIRNVGKGLHTKFDSRVLWGKIISFDLSNYIFLWGIYKQIESI